MSLAELAGAVRGGRVSSEELVLESLGRIERRNPLWNAVVTLRADGALADAQALDARVAAGDDPGPLGGLPLLVKDNEDCRGLPTTFGSLLRADAPLAAADCEAVARLRAAGAIVVGKTNVPEFAFEGFTANRLFGDTPNPWAPEWSPGGSSGGSAVALITGMAPLATGTDGGGSVRIPAGFCGLVGFKPTTGLIGQWPPPSWIELSTKGPMATSVADARLLLDVLRGPIAGAPGAAPTWTPPRDAPVRRILATPRLVAHDEPLPPALVAAFDAVLHTLGSSGGLPVERIDPPYPTQLDEDWAVMASVDELTWLGRELVEARMDEMTEYLRGAMGFASRISVDAYQDARRRRFGFARRTDELLGEDAVLLSPTMCVEGFPVDGRLPGAEAQGTEGFHYNTQPANTTGHPALSVPAGLSPNGVPFGLQITGPRYRDDLVLDIGATWEELAPWPVAAPEHDPFALP